MPVRRALFQDGRSAKRSRTTINRTIYRAISSRQETKVKRINQFLNSPNAGVTVELNDMSNGPDNGERVGNRIRNLRLTAQLVTKQTGAVRIVIYCPKNPNASLAPSTRFSSINPSDFWVLHDKIYVDGPNGTYTININKKLNFHTHWSGTSSNGFQRNPLKCFISTDDQGGVNGTVEGHFNLYYKDS